MLGHTRNWRNFFFLLTVLVGITAGDRPDAFSLNLNFGRPVLAQSETEPESETTATDSSFLQGLLQLNQEFLAGRSQLRQLSNELSALDRNTKNFQASYFENYVSRVKDLQQKIGVLETQLGRFSDADQQLALKTELEQQGVILKNLLTLSESFVGGFNPTAIRKMQELLDFFERENLPDSSYGFYGSVTQTELTTYLDQQLQEFANNLKELNQIATKGAIAPNLDTSIQYLYTTLSLESTLNPTSSGGGNLQQTVDRLAAENEILQQRVKSTHRIILFLPLIVMLPTTVLVFILFYYFGKIFQEKVDQPPNYQFSLNDIYGLEEELIAKLAQKYELKPKLLSRRDDPFANKLISLAAAPAIEAPSSKKTEVDQKTSPTDKIETDSDIVSLEPILDGEIDAEDEDEDFPVHLPNAYDELVDRYNKDAAALSDEAIALSISHQESYLDDESEFTPILLLTESDAGEYWTTPLKSLDYLVPKANLTITSDNFTAFKNIFICYGYQPDTVQKAKLLKPARVSPTEEEATWELVQQGIVVLHRI
ncbi:hypothetical protein Lepto7376_3056 [[Leptolyngbya] sp. PCC 7376]|uniref:hypothetical protein n=1 Tax=[Leptolyngbya] sp. PCC 7376 TaxID=111781 RepID=UPI00029F3E63|nr:hypothetical protein [[Leptolyngbya] sp. PCC 7376]AFY39296.1 hypothetical protein Lepto7376_3056 [[Leptolyngbya] sp. PCC 7376]